MATLTIELPDDKQARLERLAQQRHLSLNELMDELSTQALKEFDMYLRFLARAAQGDKQQGLDLLDKLDTYYQQRES